MKGFYLLPLLLLSACTFSAVVQPASAPTGAGAPPPAGGGDEAGQVYEVPLRYEARPDVRCFDGIGLNVRSGPGVGYEVVGWLEYGDIVQVYETRQGWARIGSGWVRESYLCLCE